MKKSKGFTLTELLAVIVILGILIGIAIPIYINITKNIKENEYQSKKTMIESLAVNYAEEYDLTASKFTAARLISNGMMSADKYVMEEGIEIPFVINPKDENDNMSCHIITLTMENHEFRAELSDESDCSFTVQEVNDINLGITAYRLDGNTIVGKEIYMTPDANNPSYKIMNWVNKDVLIAINPKDDKEVRLIVNGNTQTITSENMLSDIKDGMTVKNQSEYSNVIVARAEKILKSDVPVNLQTEEGINKITIGVRIDKEAAIVNTEKFSGWTSKNKRTLVYLSDGNGSGPKGVYLTKTPTLDKNNDPFFNVNDDGSNAALIEGAIGDDDGGLENGIYYLWPVDIAGNIASTPTALEIKNIDDKPPVISDMKWSIDSDVSNPTTGEQNCENGCRKAGINDAVRYDRSRRIEFKIADNESGMQKAVYCVTKESTCEPSIPVISPNDNYSFSWTNARDAQRLCYKAIDNVNNETETVCTDTYLVDGSGPGLISFSFDGLRTIRYNFNDSESGYYYYIVRAVNRYNSSDVKTVSGSVSDFYGSLEKSSYLGKLNASKTYDVTFYVYNRANSVGTPSNSFYTNYNVDTGYTFCKASNGWCNGDDGNVGVFVRYGDYKFVLYKKDSAQDGQAVFGISTNAGIATSLIDTTCCDHGRCIAPYIFGESQLASGIYGNRKDKFTAKLSLKKYFEDLPSNRVETETNTNPVTKKAKFNLYYLTNSDFKAAEYSETRTPLQWRNEDIPDKVYISYTYPVPSKDIKTDHSTPKSTTCYIRTENQKNDGKDGSTIKSGNFYVNSGTYSKHVGEKYNIHCKKEKTSDQIKAEAVAAYNEKYNPDITTSTIPTSGDNKKNYDAIKNEIDKYYRISRDLIIEANDPADDSNEQYKPQLTVGTDNNNMNYKVPSTFTKPAISEDDVAVTYTIKKEITSNFGLLDYPQYAKLSQYDYIKKINNGNSLSTLLSTYVNKVIYKKSDFNNYWSTAFGHDGLNAYISSIFANKDGYWANTPMKYGSNQAAMVLPFNPTIPFIDGNGEEGNPFVIGG